MMESSLFFFFFLIVDFIKKTMCKKIQLIISHSKKMGEGWGFFSIWFYYAQRETKICFSDLLLWVLLSCLLCLCRHLMVMLDHLFLCLKRWGLLIFTPSNNIPWVRQKNANKLNNLFSCNSVCTHSIWSGKGKN